MVKFSKFVLKLFGWKTFGEVVKEDKCIFVGAPHTSAWDFVVAWLYYKSVGGDANILIKKEFFFWPMGFILKKMGGLAIERSKGANVIRQAIQLFNKREHIHLAITPEGTRKLVKKWKAGFHIIARSSNVPVYLCTFDWGRKQVGIYGKFELSDNYQEDINRIKDFYREKGVQGKFPELFSTEH
ncbi:MAG: 1-acyl-sn-glycerol-3-phosphate acyltransferase [Prolixibacteraceae bacterium]|nr:1-acyl-sn-glycerol-3-phosphate acyltransferase [Prolixibacteraceae bacterium]